MTSISFSSPRVRWIQQTQHVYFVYQSIFYILYRHRSGKVVTDVRIDRQCQLKQVLRFGIGSCGSIFLAPGEAYILSTAQDYLSLKTLAD
jgi:hypothetical protein